MPCVNHPEREVQSYCQSCGKPLCSSCVRTTASGQILCEPCFAATAGDPSRANWQAPSQPYPSQPFPMPPGGPNPAAAAVLGLIPGVGAMYNGQLFKGLIHVVIFAVLVSITDSYGVFGIFIAAWVLYQSFEAFHTAKARRDGLPLPDPFGLNDLGSWLNLGGRSHGAPPTPPPPPPSAPPAGAPYGSSWSAEPSGYAPPPQAQYTEPYVGEYPPGYVPPGYVAPGYVPPPVPNLDPSVPVPSWRRREPVWAVVLIALGVIFLLQSLGVVSHLFHFAWPILLIGFGIWLIIRRVGYFQGGSK